MLSTPPKRDSPSPSSLRGRMMKNLTLLPLILLTIPMVHADGVNPAWDVAVQKCLDLPPLPVYNPHQYLRRKWYCCAGNALNLQKSGDISSPAERQQFIAYCMNS